MRLLELFSGDIFEKKETKASVSFGSPINYIDLICDFSFLRLQNCKTTVCLNNSTGNRAIQLNDWPNMKYVFEMTVCPVLKELVPCWFARGFTEDMTHKWPQPEMIYRNKSVLTG